MLYAIWMEAFCLSGCVSVSLSEMFYSAPFSRFELLHVSVFQKVSHCEGLIKLVDVKVSQEANTLGL